MPCTTPGTPPRTAAPPAGSTPTSRAVGVDESREDPDRVRTATDASDDDVGVTTGQRPALLSRLVADHPVELTNHPRVRVRTHHRTQAVVAVTDGGDPVPHRLVDGVLERLGTAVHRFDLGAEQLHPEHVQRLPLDIDGTHVHLALEPHQRRRRCRRHPVLAGAGLCHQPGLAHPLGQQCLAEHVVDLVRSGVIEVLALEQHPEPQSLAEPKTFGEHRRTTCIVAQDRVELGSERRVGPRLAESGLQLLARRHQRLGNESSAELAEPARLGRLGHQ